MKFSIAIVSFVFLMAFTISCNNKTAEKVSMQEAKTTTTNPVSDSTPPTPDTTMTWHPPVNEKNTKSDKEAYSYLKYKKTPCFGKCPIYEANFYTDGRVTYHGRNFVEHIGHFESRITEKEKQRIRTAFFDANFLEMALEYPVDGQKVADLPTTVIEFRVGDMIKHTTNRSQAPQELMDLQMMVEGVLDRLEWVPAGAEK